MLEWLEMTRLAVWVGSSESLLAFPTVLTLHTVGLAGLVGASWMLDLRLLGVNRRVPLSCFRWVVPVAVIGLIVNVITGAMLFMKSATVYGSSTPFFVKMALVLIGAATLAPLLAQVRRDDADNNNEVSGRLRLLATASILVWTAAVTVGRLLAYPHLLFQ